MNIKEWWNSIFKPTVSLKTNELTKYHTFIDLPKRKDFKRNKEVISKINEYKKRYRKIIFKNNTIISKDLSFGDYNEELRMNLTLILNLIIKNEDAVQLFNLKTDNEFKLRTELNNLKLGLYEQRINEMTLETVIRGIALNELYYENFIFLRKDKITAINEELYSLKMQLNNLCYQKYALLKERKRFETEIRTNEILKKTSIEEIEKQAKEKLTVLYNQVGLLFPNIINELRKRNDSALVKLAYLERVLEIYTYTHKSIIDQINLELDYYLNNSIDNNLLNKINYYEIILNIFMTYGYKMVSNELLSKLYIIKFRELTKNIYNQNESPFKNCNKIEFEIYKEIVLSKIDELSFDSKGYMKKTFEGDYKTAIRIIKSYFKNMADSKLYPELILTDLKRLRLLLACEKENGIEEFFHLQKDNKDDYDSYIQRGESFSPLNYIAFDETYYTWEEKLPLDTLFRLDYPKSYNLKISIYLLERLYLLHKKHFIRDKEYYYLPDGLKVVNYTNARCRKNKEGTFSCYITKVYQEIIKSYFINNYCLKMVFPESLQTWRGNICIYQDNSNSLINIDLLKLNRSLKCLELSNPVNKLIIPSNLKNINEFKIKWYSLKIIEFEDFKNSTFLHSKTKLKDFFSHFLVIKKTYSFSNFQEKYEECTELLSIKIILTIEERSIEIDLIDEVCHESKSNDIEDFINRFIELVYIKTGHMLVPLEQNKKGNVFKKK